MVNIICWCRTTVMNSAQYTKQVYYWESDSTDVQRRTTLPVNELRIWANKVCKKEYPDKPLPHIVAGKGVRYMNEYMSFFQGDLIVLSRHQRNKLVLLHEICHYLGSSRELDHGPTFQNRYARLLFEYIL